MPSYGISIPGDHTERLRRFRVPVIARVREQVTYLDLRTVDPADDELVSEAARGC